MCEISIVFFQTVTYNYSLSSSLNHLKTKLIRLDKVNFSEEWMPKFLSIILKKTSAGLILLIRHTFPYKVAGTYSEKKSFA